MRGLGQRGFRWAFFLQLGAFIELLLWAVVAFIGATFLVQNTLARVILGTTGILLLLGLAYQALKEAYRGRVSETKTTNVHGDFALGAAH